MNIPIRIHSSPHFNRIPNRTVVAVVIHTCECRELPHAEDNVAAWFANPSSKVSAHYVVGADEIVQCVPEDMVAWHAGPVNDFSIGIELTGSATQNAEGWADEYSQRVLANAAELVGDICRRYGIPVEHLAPNIISLRCSGIFGHVDAVKAFGHGTHFDPGPAFPWDEFLGMVSFAMALDAPG